MSTEILDPAAEIDLTERYQVQRHLGSGGNGDAYLAWDTSLRREVVIKRIRSTGSEKTLQQLMDEAAKMAATRHPNIVSIYDIALTGAAPCIIMEHVHGRTVEDHIQVAPFSLAEMVDVARQCLEALGAAHHVGLIHRDLKPSNIMLSDLPSGSLQVKVLDFGMAKFIDSATPSPQTVAIDGSILGSIHFISPEQLNRDPVDARSDLYSLGCTLYYGLTGAEPFGGDTVPEVITSHLVHRVQPAYSLRPDLKPALNAWLMRMIALEASQRFTSAQLALEALHDAARRDGVPVATGTIRLDRGTASLPARPRSMVTAWSVAGAIAILVLIACLWAYSMSGAHRSAPSVALPPEPGAVPTLPPTLVSVPPPSSASSIPDSAAAVPQPEPVLPQPATSVTAIPAAPLLTPEAAAPILPAPARVVMEVVGSNTIGAKLMPALLRAFLEKKGMTDFATTERAAEEHELSFGAPDSQGRQAVIIRSHGSSTAFQALQNGLTDLGMSSRPIKPDEAAKLASLGDMTSSACEHVIGLDGLAVVVHRDNPIEALTVQQVAALFSGQIKDWSEVGGRPGPVSVYARDDKSGTYDSFKSLVLGDHPLRADARRFEDSTALSTAVATDSAAIGFIGLPYVRNTRAIAVSDVGTLPMLPSPFTVGTEDYVLARRLFFYTPAVPSNPWTAAFVEFVLSDEGQKIVESTGFIAQKVEVESVRVRPGLPAPYVDTIHRTSGRMSLSFRFLSGRAELDAKGVRDLERVAYTLSRPENRNRHIYLLGFSDSSGLAVANQKLSRERAEAIARQLSMRGIPVAEVLAFGQELPIASNETKAGQNKNRRVEVWIE